MYGVIGMSASSLHRESTDSLIIQAHGGITYHDTNPEKEEERFIRGIQEMVEWLGQSHKDSLIQSITALCLSRWHTQTMTLLFTRCIMYMYIHKFSNSTD